MTNSSATIQRSDLFQLIVIRDTNRSISSTFQNGRKVDYEPSYQRGYVWNDSKASYLIETILLHGEIPPITAYKKNDMLEVIDGRQRCQSIVRFISNEFALKPYGLDRLWNLAGKTFRQLDEKLQERIKNAMLRFMVIEAKDENKMTMQAEEAIKREIFKRCNMGISPLRMEEVFKAQYIQDDINIHFKRCFEMDKDFFEVVKEIFDHRKRNLETMMQHIRQLLVIHHIPINRFALEREDIVNKYYDYLSYSTGVEEGKEHVGLIFESFRRTVGVLQGVRKLLQKNGSLSDGLIFETLYWAMSVCETEEVPLSKIDNPAFKKKLAAFIAESVQNYRNETNSRYQQVRQVYNLIASFFMGQLDIPFSRYLRSNDEFIVQHKERIEAYLKERFKPGEEKENISKMTPTSNTITDILDRMRRGRFELRPPYQREEVMDVKKASSLIESILLGIRLNPIFVYLRDDGVAEVIDGQQRLLAVLGFLGEQYMDSNGELQRSRKHQFRLNLQSGLLPQVHGKKFNELPEVFRKRLMDCDISIIEIREQDNKHLKPEDLFKRFNYKPYPIKLNSFEFWNAYIDSDIIKEMKAIQRRNEWLALRKEDKRMLNEELVTCLGFLHFMTQTETLRMKAIKEILAANAHPAGIVVAIKHKSQITAMLENPVVKGDFLLSLNSFEMDFIEKVKLLIASPSGKTSVISANRRLDALLQTANVRSAMSFYVLWWILSGVSIEYITDERQKVESRINMIFSVLRNSRSGENLEKMISDTWALSRAAAAV